MALRPAKIYRKVPKMPYTRQSLRVKERSYIKGVPQPKIRMFELGNKEGDFDHILTLRIKEDCCVRHNALEAMRIAANSYLKKMMDDKSYFLKVHVYPHHVLRYHPLAGVAQADRYYQGMSRPFGRPDGTAAICRKNQVIISIGVNEDKVKTAKEALRRAGMKLPVGFKIGVE